MTGEILGTLSGFGFTLISFLVALIVIVFVHEFGHYIVGRWSGIRADVFSVGFGPVVWSRHDKRGTRWQIAAIPFGGYVKFAGDASATSSPDFEALEGLDEEERRHTMHGAPLWARAATVAAGPVFNFILSIFVFGLIFGYNGLPRFPITVDKVLPSPYEVGLEKGDTILAVDGQGIEKAEDFWAVLDDPALETPVTYLVERGGSTAEVEGVHPLMGLVSGLTPGSAAVEAGFELGDVITHVDGDEIFKFTDLQEIVTQSDGRELDVTIWREGENLSFDLSPKRMDIPLRDGGFETKWLIGVTGGLAFEAETDTPGPWRIVELGFNQTVFVISSSISGVYHIVTGQIDSCNLRGAVSIAKTSGEAANQGFGNFIWFIAVLSTAIGFLNLLPIPVLDGGHLVFHTFEAAFGRPPSEGAMRIMMTIGLALVIFLMVFGLTNDFTCP